MIAASCCAGILLICATLMSFQDPPESSNISVTNAKFAKVKMITNGQVSANGTYSYVGRIEYKMEKPSGRYSCAGTFVSYGELTKERRFYFLTAAHCFAARNAKRRLFPLTKKEFSTIDVGTGRIAYGSFRSNRNPSTRSRNPLSMYLFVDPTVNIIRVKSSYDLRKPHRYSCALIDMAAVELTKTQAAEVVMDGGTFVKGEESAYVSPPQVGERCTFIGLGGMQTAAVTPSTRLCKSYVKPRDIPDQLCLEMLPSQSGIRPLIEDGDSGGPVVCLRSGKEKLVALIVSSTATGDCVVGPETAALRQFLISVYRDGDAYRVSPVRG